MLCTICIIFKMQCIKYTVQYALYKVYCKKYTVQNTLYNMHCTMCTVQNALYKIHCTICYTRFRFIAKKISTFLIFSHSFHSIVWNCQQLGPWLWIRSDRSFEPSRPYLGLASVMKFMDSKGLLSSFFLEINPNFENSVSQMQFLFVAPVEIL